MPLIFGNDRFNHRQFPHLMPQRFGIRSRQPGTATSAMFRMQVSAHRHRLVFCRWSGFFGAIESAQAAFEAVSVSAGGGFAAFLDAVGAD